MTLNITKLREFLTKINGDKAKKELYSSKIYAMIQVLFTNIGSKVGRIAKLGTVAKTPTGRKSDLDIIFCMAPDKAGKDLYPILDNKLKQAFGASIKTTSNPNYLHVEMVGSKCIVDFILLNQKDFDAGGRPVFGILTKLIQLHKMPSN